jgi:lysophospholipase L1-like esterase
VQRFLALGDSYTIGEGVSESERWPNQLAQLLTGEAIALEQPEIIARTAWAADELADAIAANPPQGPYDLVTLLIGVNDQYRNRPVDAFASEFARLIRRAKEFAGNRAGRVVAISIPDWGATPYAKGRDRALIGREIDAYNARARTLALAASIRWADVTGISRRALEDPTLIGPDGLHPSGTMYALWSVELLAIARSALAGKRRSRQAFTP